MTVIFLGNRSAKKAMQFSFDSEMDAFTFYAMAKDHYREDDLVVAMMEEEIAKEMEDERV